MCGQCEVCNFRNVPAMEAEIQMKMYSALQVKFPIAANLTWLVAHARRARGIEFQETPSKGSRDTTKKLLCSQSKVLSMID